MAGLVPAIHVFLTAEPANRRGCPAQACPGLDPGPGMTKRQSPRMTNRERTMARTTLSATLVALSSLLAPAHAQDAVDVAKAKAEGKLVWYTSTPIEQGQKIIDAFQKETGIK